MVRTAISGRPKWHQRHSETREISHQPSAIGDLLLVYNYAICLKNKAMMHNYFGGVVLFTEYCHRGFNTLTPDKAATPS